MRDRNTLVEANRHVAQGTALKHFAHLLNVLGRDDLLAMADVALVEAASEWDPGRAPLDSDPAPFLSSRVRRRMVDALRKEGWFRTARAHPERRIRPDDIDRPVRTAYGTVPLSQVLLGGVEPQQALKSQWDAEEVDQMLSVVDLSERDRAILHLYFWGGETQARIAEKFGVVESRVTQILKANCSKLRQVVAR